jgi:hypothetical protein
VSRGQSNGSPRLYSRFSRPETVYHVNLKIQEGYSHLLFNHYENRKNYGKHYGTYIYAQVLFDLDNNTGDVRRNACKSPEMHVSLHLKCTLFLLGFNHKWNVSSNLINILELFGVNRRTD